MKVVGMNRGMVIDSRNSTVAMSKVHQRCRRQRSTQPRYQAMSFVSPWVSGCALSW
jgi:hypothetical protein